MIGSSIHEVCEVEMSSFRLWQRSSTAREERASQVKRSVRSWDTCGPAGYSNSDLSVMPPKRRRLVGLVTPCVKRMRRSRVAEGAEERETRLEANREWRIRRTGGEREARQTGYRVRESETRNLETKEQRESRLRNDQERRSQRRSTELSGERTVRLEAVRERVNRSRRAVSIELKSAARHYKPGHNCSGHRRNG